MLYYVLGCPPPGGKREQGVCYTMCWGPHHFFGGNFWGLHHLCCSPQSQLAPFTPNWSSGGMRGKGGEGVYHTMFWGPHHLCGGKGLGSKLGVRGVSQERSGNKGSKRNVIVGFRVPTTCGRKNWWSHIVLRCPQDLEVQSPPNLHSYSRKRPS